MLSRPQIVDTCLIEVAYTAEIVSDTLSSTKIKDIVLVQVGDSLLKYFSWVCWRVNMNHTLFEMDRGEEQVSIDAQYQPFVDYTIIRDMKRKELLNRHLLPRMDDLVHEYSEPLPSFDWMIMPDTLTIEGYLCHKAESRFRGRNWVVWFTPQIPIDGGLWKFNGLPGLIVEAYDDRGNFHFTLRSITPRTSSIVCYDIPVKRYTRDKYRSTERQIFAHPMSGDELDFIFVPNPETGQPALLPDDWQIPYNPIERE